MKHINRGLILLVSIAFVLSANICTVFAEESNDIDYDSAVINADNIDIIEIYDNDSTDVEFNINTVSLNEIVKQKIREREKCEDDQNTSGNSYADENKIIQYILRHGIYEEGSLFNYYIIAAYLSNYNSTRTSVVEMLYEPNFKILIISYSDNGTEKFGSNYPYSYVSISSMGLNGEYDVLDNDISYSYNVDGSTKIDSEAIINDPATVVKDTPFEYELPEGADATIIRNKASRKTHKMLEEIQKLFDKLYLTYPDDTHLQLSDIGFKIYNASPSSKRYEPKLIIRDEDYGSINANYSKYIRKDDVTVIDMDYDIVDPDEYSLIFNYDSDIIRISEDGIVKGLKEGSTVVEVVIKDKLAGTKLKIEKIEISVKDVDRILSYLTPFKTDRIPELKGATDICFTNPKIASVNKRKGILKLKRYGETYLSFKNNGVPYKFLIERCYYKVPKTVKLKVGDWKRMKPLYNYGVTSNWVIKKAGIVDVDKNGRVTALQKGKVKVYTYLNGKRFSTLFKVRN